MEPKLRITKRLQEIYRLLDGLPAQSELSLWINRGDKRQLFPGVLIKVDRSQNLLFIELREGTPDLTGLDHCFVRLTPSEGVARCAVSVFHDRTLVLEISDELVLTERRRHRRIFFQSEDGKKVRIKIDPHTLELDVINASRGGLRVRVDSGQTSMLKQSGSFEIEAIGNQTHPIPARLVWTREGSAAIALEEEIPEEIFKEFIRLPRSANVDPEKFFQDQEYFQTVRSNMESIISRLEKRPKFATAMRTLKVDRNGNYLKTHIDLLCYVSCSIGRTLGWVTESTIDKLIYVSYLHDLRYFDMAHLARIPSKAAFDAQKDSLSEEERTAYLEGPGYSALMSKDDEMNSIDVERILIQQKERPDGSGFPAGISFKQLFPLSCLFIISHEFVDYVYEHPDWSFRKFVDAVRPQFKGPYFIKILQAIEELETSRARY